MPLYTSGILNAYLAGKRIRQQREAQEREFQLKERELAQEQQMFNDRLKQVSDQFKTEQTLKNAQFDHDLLKTRIEGSKALAQEHLSPDSETEETVSLSLPKIGTISAPNPKAIAKRKAQEKIDETTNLFKAQTPLAVDRAKGIAEVQNTELMKRDQTRDLARSKEAEAKQKFDAQEAEKRFKERIQLAHIQGGYRMSAAARKQKEVDFSPEELNVAVKNLADGSTTLEELTKSGYTQAERRYIIEEMGRQKLKPVNNATKANFQQMQAVKKIFEQVTRLRDMIKASPYKSTIPFSDARGLAGRINAQLGTLASQVGGQKGAISLKDVRAMESYVARFDYGLINPKVNDEVVKDFETLLRSRQNSLMPNFSRDQKEILNQTYNLLPTHLEGLEELTPEQVQKLGRK